MDKPAAPHSLLWSGQTDRGKVRPNNEDSFLALRFDAREVQFLGKVGDASTEQHDYVFAVSDGMGGAKAGEFASRITVEKVTRLLPRSYKQSALGIGGGLEDVMAELFDQIHHQLLDYGSSYDECQGMGATLSLCWFTPGWMHFGHIGDSRIYYLPAGSGALQQLTHDDTHVGWLYRQGRINEREARSHPARSSLQKVLGAGHQFIDPQVGAVGYEPGDKFLLCTDGVIDGLFDSTLLDMLRAPGTTALELVNAAVENSGRDNATALIIEVR
ncbi:MAG: protein phosphatase 2C domain-containing protein [Chthoniobacteraceae bacterium]